MAASFVMEGSRSRKLSESEAKETASLSGSREEAKLNREEATLNRQRAILDCWRAISNRQPYF
jgi:hypothetical protein